MHNLCHRFDWYYIRQIYGGDFTKFCGLLFIWTLMSAEKKIKTSIQYLSFDTLLKSHDWFIRLPVFQFFRISKLPIINQKFKNILGNHGVHIKIQLRLHNGGDLVMRCYAKTWLSFLHTLNKNLHLLLPVQKAVQKTCFSVSYVTLINDVLRFRPSLTYLPTLPCPITSDFWGYFRPPTYIS